MKALKKDVHEAYVRAHRHLIRLPFKGTDDDTALLAGVISACQSGWLTLGDSLKVQFNESLFQLALDDNRRAVLMKKIAAANNYQPNSRERVLIAYLRVIDREGRLPFVRELRGNVAAQLGRKTDPKKEDPAIPDERSIRFILRELQLPLTSTPGPPKKNRK
jgi:hypothetical protein